MSAVDREGTVLEILLYLSFDGSFWEMIWGFWHVEEILTFQVQWEWNLACDYLADIMQFL